MRGRVLLGFFAVALMTGPAAAGLLVDFQFDGTFNDTLTPPIVGTGTFEAELDPGDGTFGLADLGVLDIAFTILGFTFTEADIATPIDEILVILSTSANGRRLQFSNETDDPSGPFGGSIDFVNADGSGLSFEPPGNGDGGLNLYAVLLPSDGGGNELAAGGTYLGGAAADAVVPEPGTLGLLAMGGLGVVGGWYRKRKTAVAA